MPTGNHLDGLHDAIGDSRFARTPCLIGEDQSHKLVGDEPILYSLPGTTLANVDEDVELFRPHPDQ